MNLLLRLSRRLVYALSVPMLLTLGSLVSCDSPVADENATLQTDFGFRLVPSAVDFSNEIIENDSLNVVLFDYMYNGAGVAIADVDNDGREDLFFSGNMVNDRLYLNKGNFQFEDVSEAFGLNEQPGWSNGAVFTDINKDGFADLYVCRGGPSKDPNQRRNLLYINQQGKGFIEMGAEYGLDYSGHSTMAVFFDADLDGDEDCFVITHPGSFKHNESLRDVQQKLLDGKIESDRFYIREGDRFLDRTKESGLTDFAYSLGVAVEDFNNDGLPDIYVSNDFDEGDAIYFNRGGVFEQVANKALKHTSNYGMGCDAADFNNDLWVDIFTLDMAFPNHERAKRNMASMQPDRFFNRVNLGFHYQYMANCLHMGMGDGTWSDVAQVAGVDKTDWSWAGLFADFDTDGMQDLFVTNGYKRDTKDNDIKSDVDAITASGKSVTVMDVLDVIPTSRIPNMIYKNSGDLRFENMSEAWGLDAAINSNGAAYTDLDNDGDLDLVVNNMDAPASIYENIAQNTRCIQMKVMPGISTGTRVVVYADGKAQMRYDQPVRGFMSSVSRWLHVGLGNSNQADSILVFYPNGTFEKLENVASGSRLELEGNSSKQRLFYPPASKWFASADALLQPRFVHNEMPFKDYENEVLLPHSLSHEGPAIAAGDLNGDGIEDLWIGGGAGQGGVLYIALKDGTYAGIQPKVAAVDAAYEDQAGAWFDYDGDGDDDLYVGSGSHERQEGSPLLRDRLYKNDKGELSWDDEALPDLRINTSCVVPFDMDGDGDLDLFVGARSIPSKYPLKPSSALLRNDGGRFTNVSGMHKAIELLGMVTGAAAGDFNGDGKLDLCVVGEWMAPLMILNKDGYNDAIPLGEHKEGWWQSVVAEDIDQDGDLDIIAGNIGLNNKFHPSPEHPLHCYAADFDDNGQLDIVLAKERGNELLPVRGKQCSSQQMPFLLDKFHTYKAFAEANLAEIYSENKLAEAYHLIATHFASTLFLNENGKFKSVDLPVEAQLSPIRAACAMKKDGKTMWILAGNRFHVEVETTRYDAGDGVVLLFDSTNMTAKLTTETGLSLGHDITSAVVTTNARGQQILMAVSNKGAVMARIISESKL